MVVAGNLQSSADVYMRNLIREIDLTPTPPRPPIACSIYFGGGTPSLVAVEHYEHVLKAVAKKFSVDSNAEITMEMDPGTFDGKYLKNCHELGFNRLSIGVQSFDNHLLDICKRTHRVDDIYKSLEMVHASKFDNFNIDLISSLPGSTLDRWERTLDEAISTGATHMSIYDLQIEENTLFGQQHKLGLLNVPPEVRSAEMYKLASSKLREAGFEHYEVSNYARSPSQRSQHNLKYWRRLPVYAFGMGATSYVNGVRFTRPRLLREYGQWVDNLDRALGACSHGSVDDIPGSAAGSSMLEGRFAADADAVVLSREDIGEIVMLSLRMSEGLDLVALGERTGDDALVGRIINAVQPYVESGHAIVQQLSPLSTANRSLLSQDSTAKMKEFKVTLTDPDGFLISNDVISSILARL